MKSIERQLRERHHFRAVASGPGQRLRPVRVLLPVLGGRLHGAIFTGIVYQVRARARAGARDCQGARVPRCVNVPEISVR